MTKFGTLIHTAASAAIASSLMAAVPSNAFAETVDLEFRPPDVVPAQICGSRPSDAETIERWSNWDGNTLPDIDTQLIKRDIKRLEYIDGRKWYDTIEAMIAKLSETDPSFAGTNALLEHILALESAGMYDKLLKSQMVEELAALGSELSPRLQNVLSHFYRDGVGVPRDLEKADALLVTAGYAGNADAILTLSKRTLQGDPVEGWDVPVDLGVTMAFGALVGELNPTICDRTARIAREYHSGELVEKNAQLAHDWFRFTADLGDSYAAWRVVEYHLEAEEGFQKDNAVLLTYLQQAADAKLPYAQIELGRLYEAGSLVETDLDKTLELFRAAAASGERAGLIRLALFLEKHKSTIPDGEAERMDALQKLAALDDAPGWVFSRLAQHELDTQGYWAGREDALALLEKAVALEDLDGTIRLAELLVSRGSSQADFNRAVDLLTRTLSDNGSVGSSKALHSMYMCQGPDSPNLAEASYWDAMEVSTDTAKLDVSLDRLDEITPEGSPLDLAVMQSQALYGRPTSLALWLEYLDVTKAGDEELIAFWKKYSDRYDDVLKASAKIGLESATSSEERMAAIELLRAQYRKSGASAALDLAQALLDVRPSTGAADEAAALNAEALSLLETPASEGNGRAIAMIARLDDAEKSEVYATYADAIDRNGDYEALLFALPFVEDGQRDEYLARAVGVITCDYKNVMALADASYGIGDVERALHWQEVASNLTDNNAWAIADLAEAKLEVSGMDVAEEAWDLYLTANDMGDKTASRALFDLAIAEDAPTYDPDFAVGLINSALDKDQPELLGSYLSRYRSAPESVRTALGEQLDMPRVHLAAAESGDVFAMRVYGRYLQNNAENADDLVAATDWLRRSAEGGDTYAMAEYGEALAFGIGIDADPDAALEWLARAAADGNEKAKEITRLVKLSAADS